MPGVSDADLSESGPSPREKAESAKLWLPSQLDAAERDSLCLGGVIASEKELRFGQLHDSLNELRRARRNRSGLIIFHHVQLAGEGTKTQTKSQGVMRTVQERIDRAVQRYRAARAALLCLDPSGSWQELYRVLEDRDNRGPGKELIEKTTSDGQYTLSWIWLSNPSATAGDLVQSTISPDEVNEDMRVEWAQCMARADRWEEEAILLQEEMRRVVSFLDWKSKDWVSKVNARASVVKPEIRSGLSAYARKQASVFGNLAIRFCERWCSALISLSLSHAWASKFLESRGVLPADLDLEKHKPEESPTRHHAEPPAALHHSEPTAAASHILTSPETCTNNAKTSNDTPGTSSENPTPSNDSDESTDDSDVDSSESEYEPGGW